MRQFTDRQNRIWKLEINLGAAMLVKAALGIDLLTPEAGEPPLLSRLATDEFLLGSAICELLRRQFEEQKLTEADVYAAHQADAGDLVHALVKLYQDNASTLTPDPVHSAFYDSHPPAALRIARLQAFLRMRPT